MNNKARRLFYQALDDLNLPRNQHHAILHAFDAYTDSEAKVNLPLSKVNLVLGPCDFVWGRVGRGYRPLDKIA